jgi:hypothetical protein
MATSAKRVMRKSQKISRIGMVLKNDAYLCCNEPPPSGLHMSLMNNGHSIGRATKYACRRFIRKHPHELVSATDDDLPTAAGWRETTYNKSARKIENRALRTKTVR